jgi:tetratricopeptide (TPR) repeat protein
MFSAQATFEDALEIYREVLPSETDRMACLTQMAEVLCNIGSIRNKQKSFTGAIDCFREALDVQRGIMGHDDPKIIATLDNLGYSFAKNKSYNQALTCYKEMLNAQISQNGSFTLACCETLKKQTLIYGKLKNLDGAINATKSVLQCLDRRGAHDPVIAETTALLLELKEMRRKRSCAC